MKFFIIILLLFTFSISAFASENEIDVLRGTITPENASRLAALCCKNSDAVHINIKIEWPKDKIYAEDDGFERLIFWDDKNEYLFLVKHF